MSPANRPQVSFMGKLIADADDTAVKNVQFLRNAFPVELG
jgi:hypothetical protein